MYGSNFCRATFRPRATSRRPMDAAAMPFPSEETTPPVTKMKRVRGRGSDTGLLPVPFSLEAGPAGPSGGLEQLAGVAASRHVTAVRAQHADQLAHDFALGELRDGGAGRLPRGVLDDREVAVGQR